jgi:CRISPR-associated protein Csb2
MIGLAVTFDLGRYHATSWGAHVNEATVEWPPSPWRLLRALYSAGWSNVELLSSRPDLERALALLARAGPPRFELPTVAAGHTRHYVPLASHSPTKAGDTSLLIDAFHVLDPAAELRAWWDVSLDARARVALDAATGAVGYLGRSESVCSMHLVDEPSCDECDAAPAGEIGEDERWDGSDRIELLSVVEDAADPIATLGVSVSQLRRMRMLTPPGTRRVTYAVRREPDRMDASKSLEIAAPTIAHLRAIGGNRPALTEAVTVGLLLRSALQRRFDRDRDGTRSPVLSGHDGDGPRRDQHAHAHFLAFAGRDDRRIDHLVVWAPEGLGRAELAAIAGLRELRMRDAPESFRVALVALGRVEGLVLPWAVGPATTWHSLTPLALTRHPKKRGGRIVDSAEDQVVRELTLRGLPAPRTVDLLPGSWTRFTSTRPGVSRRGAPTLVGARIHFSEPLHGPIALGGLSHFGLGLFEPER